MAGRRQAPKPPRKHSHIGVGRIGVLNSDGHAIGIDLGATGVRAAIISPGTVDGRPSVTMHGLAEEALPPGTITNGVVGDQAAVTRALKAMWEKNKFECRSVILGITNQQVVVRDITLPNLRPDQMAKALPFQAREVVPIPLDQALLDFTPLGPADAASDTIVGVMIAVPRAPVVAAVQAVERAGLSVARVDLSSFAILRAIADENVGVEAVIDIGAQLTNIVIHNQGIPKVVRAVTRGGQEWTELLVSKGGMEDAEAEAAKRAVGVSASDPRISSMVSQAVRPLLAEIRSSIQYFSSMNAGAVLERVSLTGRASLTPGLAEMFTDQLGVETTVAPPMRHIRNRYNSKGETNDEAATAVSVGLAIGAAA